jgi:hypothetical protein
MQGICVNLDNILFLINHNKAMDFLIFLTIFYFYICFYINEQLRVIYEMFYKLIFLFNTVLCN